MEDVIAGYNVEWATPVIRTAYTDPWGKDYEEDQIIRRNGRHYFKKGNGQMMDNLTGELFPLDHGL